MTSQELSDLFADITTDERTSLLDSIQDKLVSTPGSRVQIWKAPEHVCFRGRSVTPAEVNLALEENPLSIEINGEMERDGDGWKVWGELADGTRIGATWVKNKRVAERLSAAMEDGVAVVPMGHSHREDGSLYLVAAKRVLGRRASADLKALGY